MARDTSQPSIVSLKASEKTQRWASTCVMGLIPVAQLLPSGTYQHAMGEAGVTKAKVSVHGNVVTGVQSNSCMVAVAVSVPYGLTATTITVS